MSSGSGVFSAMSKLSSRENLWHFFGELEINGGVFWNQMKE